MVSDDREFEALLTAGIVAAQQAGEQTFPGLLRRLAGPDPTALLTVLRRMAPEHPWVGDLLEQALTAGPSNGERPGGKPSALPVEGIMPHPLDFDWRFTSESVATLETIYRPLVPPAGTVLFLGTPTLFKSIRCRPVDPSVRHVLIDRNAPPLPLSTKTEILASLALDVCSDPLPLPPFANVVLTDPPWYEQELRAFLWAAAALCHDGGTIIACLPGLNARPGAQSERARVLTWAHTVLGLMCLAVKPGWVRYETPPFERNAWRTAGFREIGPDWRAGDVVIFRKGPGTPPPPTRPNGPWEPTWNSLQFGEVTVRLRPDERTGFADPSLVRLYPNDVLPSVSRRHAQRAEIDVWSGGNRVFACRGCAVLERIGRALIDATPVVSAVEEHLHRPLRPDEKNLVERATDQLLVLVACERRAEPPRPIKQ